MTPREIVVHVLLCISVGDVDDFDPTPVTQSPFEKWPALLLRLRRAESQHQIGTLRVRQQLEQSHRSERRLDFTPQWTGQNRPFMDTSKPAISGGPRLELRSTSRRPLLARCLPAR